LPVQSIEPKSTTPKGIPINVVKIIPNKIADFTPRIIKAIVIAKPISVSKELGLVKLTNSGTAPLFARTDEIPPGNDSAVGSPPLTEIKLIPSMVNCNKLPFLIPIYAMKTPIPAEIACCKLSGIALIKDLRTLVTVIKTLKTPQINTIDNASCQVKPKPNTTV